MPRNKDLQYETHTPEASSLTQGPSNQPCDVHLHTWFDHVRNVMVVEVVPDPPAQAATPATEPPRAKKKAA